MSGDENSESIRKAYDSVVNFVLKTSDNKTTPISIDTIPISLSMHVPLNEVYLSLFDLLDLPEFRGIDGGLDKLVEELSGVQSFPEMKTMASTKLIELAKGQIERKGSTALFDIEALTESTGVVLIPLIIDRRKSETEDVAVPIRQGACVDLRPLTYTYTGLQIVQALGLWNFCSIDGLEEVRMALDQLGIELTVVDDESDNSEESVSITQGLKLVVSELVSEEASEYSLREANRPRRLAEANRPRKDSLREGLGLLAETNHPEAISVIKQLLGPFHNHEYSDPEQRNDWGYEPSAWTHKITGKQVPSYTTHAFEPALKALGRIGNREAKELLVRFLHEAHYSGYPDAYPKAERQGHVVRALSKKPSEQDEWLVPHLMKHLPSFYDMIDQTGQYISTEALLPMLSILVPYKPEGLFDIVLDILQNLYKLKHHEGNEGEIWKRLMHLELNVEELARVIDYLKEREMRFINPFGRAGPPKGWPRSLDTPKYPDISFLTLIQSSEEHVSEDLLAELDDIRLTSERKRWWEDSSIYASFEKEMLGRFIDYCRSRERNLET
jgi:hypothetical protein